MIGQVDAQGNLLGRLSKNSFSATVRWTKPPCLGVVKSGADFRLKSYTNSASDAAFFTVDPPVPFGTKVYLKVVCARTDGGYDIGEEIDETDCGNVVAAKFWAIFRAHFIDDERSPEYQKAMAAARMYFQLLNLKFKADMLYELGVLPVSKQTDFIDVKSQ